MANKLQQHPLWTAFGLGWLCVAALPPYYIFPVLFISLSGLLLLINSATCAGKAFKIGYAFGFAFFAFGFSWIGNALLIDAVSTGWLYPLAFLASGAFFGIFIAIPAWLSHYFKGLVAKYLVFASLWVVFEWTRSWFLTGFPWNLLGSVLAFNDKLIQFASVGGTYVLSIIVLLIAMAPALWFHYRSKISLAFAVVLPVIGITFLCVFGILRLTGQNTEKSDTLIRLVQPAIPQALKWNNDTLEDNFNQYIKLSTAPGIDKVDFTIWGETASPYPLDFDLFHMQNLKYAVPPSGYLITGLVRYEFDKQNRYQPHNSMFIIDPQGKIAGHYDKSHLVPFGEYIPLRQYLPQWIRPLTNVIGTFRAGTGPSEIKIPGKPSLGALICYEVIFPHKIIDPQNRPDWIVNLTNDGWYGDSAGPRQHLVTTKLRAVEEGITIARAANTGISALISPYGTIIGQINLNVKGILDLNLPKELQFSTTYSKYGNLFALIWCFSNIIVAFYFSFRNL